MERASKKITQWIIENYQQEGLPIHVFCGPGNNGGDGLAVARLLHLQHRNVTVYINKQSLSSEDAQSNLKRLPTRGYLVVIDISTAFEMPTSGLIIDALFGSGLSRALEGDWLRLVEKMNHTGLPTASIDIPSGMFGDIATSGTAVKADHTLCLQAPKLACLQVENAKNTGNLVIIDIGLHQPSIEKIAVENYLVEAKMIKSALPARGTFDHKGTFGHALLVCGGFGKVGAALLAARACLRVGAGKLTVHAPGAAYQILQLGVPEAMIELDGHDYWFTDCVNPARFDAVGIGCGLGLHASTAQGVRSILETTMTPLVIDADALNIIAQNDGWLTMIPKGSIITPHPGEYLRLFDQTSDSFERIEQQKNQSKALGIYIVYKNARTCITTPYGEAFFNITGNPGMATAGSGDVLTGMITGLLAQKLLPQNAVLAAVYLHGLAGDIAIQKTGQYALIASDIIEHLGVAINRTMHG
jgi:NAD(P)H-hydrate epimerase